MILSSLVTFLLFKLLPILAVPIKIKLDDCENYQYLLNGNNICQDCPACPAGQMYTKHCGYRQDFHDNITKPHDSCSTCEQGTFKSEKSKFSCQECSIECPRNREMVHSCNATHDLKCSDCKKGFYMENGGCYPCQHCCGNSKQFVKDKCVDDGMGWDCSCRSIKGCNKKCSVVVPYKPTKSIKPTSRIPTKATANVHPSRIVRANLNTASTVKLTTKEPIQPPTGIEGNTENPISGQVAGQNDKSEVSGKNSISFVDPGWLVAIAIFVLLVSVIVLAILRHLNIVKKIKVLLHNYDSNSHESRDHTDDENTVVCVSERFQSPAQPNITNYAQLVDNEDNSQTDSCLSQERDPLYIHQPNIQGGGQHVMCSCHYGDEFIPSSASTEAVGYDEQSGPWVYQEDFQHRHPKLWPPSRAEMGNSAATMYGEYIELHQDETSCPSTQPSNNDQQLIDNSNDNPQDDELENGNRENPENKEGEENSEGEETSTAIPVTIENGAEDSTVVVATGQHSGAISKDIAKSSKIPRERTKEKRKKKQPPSKKSKKLPSDINEGSLSNESLQCKCGKCSYRPYLRHVQLCSCSNCVPQRDDDLYKIIERHCLRSEICKELNKQGVSNWHELSIYIRIDKQIPDIENSKNPAHIVLEKLKTSRPRLKLEDFSVILKKIGRQDVMDLIMNHHITCILCRRNSFDGSSLDLHIKSDSWTLKSISDSF